MLITSVGHRRKRYERNLLLPEGHDKDEYNDDDLNEFVAAKKFLVPIKSLGSSWRGSLCADGRCVFTTRNAGNCADGAFQTIASLQLRQSFVNSLQLIYPGFQTVRYLQKNRLSRVYNP